MVDQKGGVMSNYKEQALTGQEWQRACRVTVSNQYGGTPAIVYDEEMIAVLNNGTRVNTPAGQLREEMADPTTAFVLMHPLTGDTIGTAHYGDLHVMLYSLYLHLAAARDTAAV